MYSIKSIVTSISENFEFARQPIREYKRKLSSREYFRITVESGMVHAVGI